MFHREGKKIKSPRVKALKDLTPMTSPVTFLTDTKRDRLVQEIREASMFEAKQFDSVVLSLINHMVHYAQLLPETSNSYYAQAGGLFDHALNRTEAAVSLFRHYVKPEEGDTYSEEQKLWLYALLSAALLQGIGKLQIDYKVELFDRNGQFLKTWQPLLENMSEAGGHYCFEFLPEGEADLRCRLNLLLAQILMPVSGLSWIVSNAEVLSIWLALLDEDEEGAGTLGAILIRAEALALQRYLSDCHASPGSGRGGRIGTFVDLPAKSTQEKEMVIAAEFVEWMIAQLESGEKILLNKAPLLMVPGGMLMSTDAFKLFVREHPEFKNWQAVQQAFLSLNLHQLAADGTPTSRFGQESGVLVKHFGVLLPSEVKTYQQAGNKVVTVAAVEILAKSTKPLAHLGASGVWKAPEEPTSRAHLSPGAPHRG